MEVTIIVNKSSKSIDELVSFMENIPNTRLVEKEIHKIETPNNSLENIQKWLSSERKLEYAKKLEEALPDFSFEVEEISISNTPTPITKII